ncbi:MAG: hypothetical protein AB9903_10440 [Vulcanimicrobiota bacterium]
MKLHSRIVILHAVMLLFMVLCAQLIRAEDKQYTITYPASNSIGTYAFVKGGPTLSRVEDILKDLKARESDLEYNRYFQGGGTGELYIELGAVKEKEQLASLNQQLAVFMEDWVRRNAESDRRMRTGSDFGGHSGQFFQLSGTQFTAFAGIWYLDDYRFKIVFLKSVTSTFEPTKVGALVYLDQIAFTEVGAAAPSPASSAVSTDGGKGGMGGLVPIIGGVAVGIFVTLYGVMLYMKKRPAPLSADVQTGVSTPVSSVSQKIASSIMPDARVTPASLSRGLVSQDAKANLKIDVGVDVKVVLADGKSKSMIKVRLTDLSDKPIDGKKVHFTLEEENGRLTAESAEIRKGECFNYYTAGNTTGKQCIAVYLEENSGLGSLIEIMLVKIEKIEVDVEKKKVQVQDKKGVKVKASLSYSDGNAAVNEKVRFRVLEGDGKITPAVKISEQGFGEAIFWPGANSGKVVVRGESASAPDIFKLIEIEQTAG